MPWVEQAHDLPRVWIEPGEIRAFVQIAIDARERKVIAIISPSVNARYNMFDMERRQW